MNIQGLIERYEKFKASKKKMTLVDLVLKDLRSLDEPEPLPFKLKDVVRRIRGFDPTTQTRWLNDILKELGDDYGSMKYRSGYEQGKLEGAWVGNQLKDADKIRQELNIPVIPQFVADFITEQKKLGYTLAYSIDASMSDRVAEWYWDNSELFVLAWILGCKVEEEKRYLVKAKGVKDYGCYLNKGLLSKEYFWESKAEIGGCRTKHTRKQLEDDDFGWVFDCPGIEIEEVEG
jgi:hypothetical protein